VNQHDDVKFISKDGLLPSKGSSSQVIRWLNAFSQKLLNTMGVMYPLTSDIHFAI
jgi:hypothetical protein